MKVGILCYASVGGSGVVATELAHALAGRGHEIHLISSDLPFRWRPAVPNLSFERVDTPTYPLFRQPQYILTLTNTIVRVSRERKLDLIHAHYAVPHATAAYLAHEILARQGAAPRTVTTLHGTDITLIGSDPSYAAVVRFSIEQSHGVTAVSESLRRDTIDSVGVQREIRVIPNFLDCTQYRRQADRAFRGCLCAGGAFDAVVIHVSNFRPVKRVGVVLDVFRRIRERVRAKLVLVGDGPDRPALEQRVAQLGLHGAVEFVGEQQDVVPWLSAADLFLLPSAQESFGMAALEAMSCAVAVVASRVGGLPEVIEDGVTGYLCEPDDVEGMAARGIEILESAELRERMGHAGALAVRTRYCEDVVVPRYEAFYREVIGDLGR